MTQPTKTFDPSQHLIELKSKNGVQQYLEVKFRLVWFREIYPHGTIETELVHLDLDRETEEEVFVWNAEKRRSEKVLKKAKGVAIFHAVVRDGKGGVGSGTKMEKAASFPDFCEKAESGAIGRALATLGFGTQFVGDDLSEAHRIVDSPVVPTQAQAPAPTTDEDGTVKVPTSAPDGDAPETLAAIKRDLRKAGLVNDLDQWIVFKQTVLKLNLPDQSLTQVHLRMLRISLEQERQRRAESTEVAA
jgi:hypothetical protein